MKLPSIFIHNLRFPDNRLQPIDPCSNWDTDRLTGSDGYNHSHQDPDPNRSLIP